MANVDIDTLALQSEVRGIVRRKGRDFMRPAAEELTQEATAIARGNFRHDGPGVASIHHEYFPVGENAGPEYKISYDGEKRSYMGLWEVGTRHFGPRPYLRPAIDAVASRGPVT